MKVKVRGQFQVKWNLHYNLAPTEDTGDSRMTHKRSRSPVKFKVQLQVKWSRSQVKFKLSRSFNLAATEDKDFNFCLHVHLEETVILTSNWWRSRSHVKVKGQFQGKMNIIITLHPLKIRGTHGWLMKVKVKIFERDENDQSQFNFWIIIWNLWSKNAWWRIWGDDLIEKVTAYVILLIQLVFLFFF